MDNEGTWIREHATTNWLFSMPPSGCGSTSENITHISFWKHLNGPCMMHQTAFSSLIATDTVLKSFSSCLWASICSSLVNAYHESRWKGLSVLKHRWIDQDPFTSCSSFVQFPFVSVASSPKRCGPMAHCSEYCLFSCHTVSDWLQQRLTVNPQGVRGTAWKY